MRVDARGFADAGPSAICEECRGQVSSLQFVRYRSQHTTRRAAWKSRRRGGMRSRVMTSTWTRMARQQSRDGGRIQSRISGQHCSKVRSSRVRHDAASDCRVRLPECVFQSASSRVRHDAASACKVKSSRVRHWWCPSRVRCELSAPQHCFECNCMRFLSLRA